MKVRTTLLKVLWYELRVWISQAVELTFLAECKTCEGQDQKLYVGTYENATSAFEGDY